MEPGHVGGGRHHAVQGGVRPAPARPPYTSQLTGGSYAGSPVLSGFAKAASNTQISPFNAKNWTIADTTDQIIPTMMKALMQGAPFQATVSKANTEMQNVLNTGKES